MLRQHPGFEGPGFMFMLLALMCVAAIVGLVFIPWELILWSEQRERRSKTGMLAMGSAVIFGPAYYIFLGFAAVPVGTAGVLLLPLVSTILVVPGIYYAIHRKLIIPGIGSSLLVLVFILEFALIISW
jgi:hypothetical protein